MDLADAVCLSPSPCLARLKRLEQAGYLAGYGAQIRLDKLGDTLTVFTKVTLADHRPGDFSRFEAGIRPIEEILACHLVSGGYDYLLKFITRGIHHYQDLIDGLLARDLGIEQYFSHVVTGSPFSGATTRSNGSSMGWPELRSAQDRRAGLPRPGRLPIDPRH